MKHSLFDQWRAYISIDVKFSMNPLKKTKLTKKCAATFIYYVMSNTNINFENLKLQMISYYLYGHFLTRNIRLFDEQIYTDAHGFYIVTIEHEMIRIHLDRNKLTLNNELMEEAISYYDDLLGEDDKKLMVHLIRLYSEYTGTELRQKCRCEPLYNKFWDPPNMTAVPDNEILAEFLQPYFEIERNFCIRTSMCGNFVCTYRNAPFLILNAYTNFTLRNWKFRRMYLAGDIRQIVKRS
jgi:uncharacterized phage-associated protein